MKKYSAIVCASLLAITLGACGGGGGTDTTDSGAPVDGSSEAVGEGEAGSTVAGTDAEPTATPQVAFAPLQSGDSVVRVRSLPSLIDSTPAAARINGTASGKADPFAGRVISVRPVPPDPEVVAPVFPLARGGGSPASGAGNALTGGTAGAAPRAGGSNAGGGRTATPTASGPGRNAGGSPSASAGAGSGSGSGSANLPDLAARPPIPDPALARGVEVTGIVQIGSVYQAIVKAPNEPTARYVTVGQRLSNGRVLVKRIESQGSEPVVVLEEDGVEVVRAIGAPVEGSAGNATAQLPQLQPAS